MGKNRERTEDRKSKGSVENGKDKKRIVAVFLLVLYISFIIYTTFLCREPGDYQQYNFQLFWSWRKIDEQAQQILLNILFFVPFGVLGHYV